MLNTTFGLVDGNFKNEQGKYGSCWALTACYGLSREAKDLYQNVIKQDDEGNAIVTFYGFNDGPLEYKISRNLIKSMITRRTYAINHNSLEENIYNNNINESIYGSSDPDAIAIEAAIKMYEDEIKKQKEDYKQQLIEYVKSSTPNVIEKPDISKLDNNITQEEWLEFINYYRNSSSEYKGKFLFDTSIDYIKPEDIENMKTYVLNSTPKEIVKPDINEISSNYFPLKNYIKNSHSDTMKKPEFKTIENNLGSISTGGTTSRAIRTMVGGTYDVYKGYHFDESAELIELTNEEKDKIISILENKDKDSKQILSASFRGSDKTVHSRHAYFISRVEDKKVYLVDPHDSSKEIAYSLKKFIDNLDSLEVNTLPDELKTVE